MSEDNEQSNVPMYERIAEVIRDQIEGGQLSPGEKLPTQEGISSTFGVSRIVARQALDLLSNEGLIDRIQGGGAFVRKYKPLVRRSSQHYRTDPGAPFAEEALASERIPRYSHHTERDHAGPDIARRLKIAVGDPIMRTDYVSYADDHPVMTVTSYEPLAITEGTPIAEPERGPYPGAGIVDRFTAIGMRPTVIVERTRARMPRPSERDLLDLGPGIPVMAITRISYTGETPIETADLLLSANTFEREDAIRVNPAT